MSADSLYNDSPAPTAEKASFLDDLIEFLPSPAKVFARRAAAPSSGLIFLLVSLLIIGLYFANRGTMQPIMDGEYNRQMAEVMRQNPSMTQEQLAAGKGFADMATTFGIIIGMPIVLLCVALGTWLTGKLVGAQLTFGAAMMVGCWSYLPRVVESIIVTIQGLVLDVSAMTGRFQLSLGVGRFLDPNMDPGLLGLLGRVDLITIWVSVLIGIGVCVVGKVPREKTMVVAAIIWTFGAIPAIGTLVWKAISG